MKKILCNIRFVAELILLVLLTCIFSLIIGVFFVDNSNHDIYNENLNSYLVLYDIDDNKEIKLFPISHYVYNFRCGNDDIVKFNKYYIDYILKNSKTTIINVQ